NLQLAFTSPSGLNGNQQAVGNALSGFFNRTGGIPLVYAAMTPASLTQASGEVGTGSLQTTFDAMGAFTNLLTDPSLQRCGGPGAAGGAIGFASENGGRKLTNTFGMVPSTSCDQRWSVWASGFGGSQSSSGNAAVGSNER